MFFFPIRMLRLQDHTTEQKLLNNSTRWCPCSESLSWCVHNSDFTMVYGTNYYSIHGFINKLILVGGLEHVLFSIMYGMSSFPLTFIFFKMVKTTNQL